MNCVSQYPIDRPMKNQLQEETKRMWADGFCPQTLGPVDL